MNRKFKGFFSLLLTLTIIMSNSTASAMANTDFSKSVTVNSQLNNNVMLIEQDLNNHGSSVEKGLGDFISLLEKEKKKATNTEDTSKLQSLIDTTNNLLTVYKNYKNDTNNSYYTSDVASSSSNPIYSVAIAAVITWFANNGYLLSAELLAHMDENTTNGAIYHPYFGTRVLSSPLYGQIMLSSDWHGTGEFTNTGTTIQKDLYYGIHNFYWKKEANVFTLHDIYDYALGDYDGMQEIAVNTMYLAQEAGELVPFLDEIIIRY
ncbi:MAG: hypothetical protein PHF63_02195 [Herbinix sp.]|nr:hypothetical protein [Herbinix sp.]